MNAEKRPGGVLNLTQHRPTPEQREDGVYDPVEATRLEIKTLLTFEEMPFRRDVVMRARRLAQLAKQEPCQQAMIGGAPFLMAEMERELAYAGVMPLYAFSRRISEDQILSDGGVKKVSRFAYEGLYAADGEMGGRWEVT